MSGSPRSFPALAAVIASRNDTDPSFGVMSSAAVVTVSTAARAAAVLTASRTVPTAMTRATRTARLSTCPITDRKCLMFAMGDHLSLSGFLNRDFRYGATSARRGRPPRCRPAGHLVHVSPHVRGLRRLPRGLLPSSAAVIFHLVVVLWLF